MNRHIAQSVRKRLLDLAGALPYGLTSRLLSLVLDWTPLQRCFFSRRKSLLSKVHRLAGSAGDFRYDLMLHLLGAYTIPWRVNALSRFDPHDFGHWVKIKHSVTLESLHSAGSPALLVSCHTAISRIVPLAISRLGYEVATLEPEPYLQRMGARGADRIQSITLRGEGEKFWMKEMFQAKKVLDAGRFLHLALDGHQGTGGVERSFLGRKRTFHVGLAKLAIQQRTPIVLVRATMDRSGQIEIEFRGPLDLGNTASTEDQRLARFLDLYVEMIENIWRSNLGNVSPRHLPSYLQALPWLGDNAKTQESIA